MSDRTIRAVPPGYLTAEDLPAFTYFPESDLPPMLAAEAEPWRQDPVSGEWWYRIATVVEDPDDMEDSDDED